MNTGYSNNKVTKIKDSNSTSKSDVEQKESKARMIKGDDTLKVLVHINWKIKQLQ
jgi:hypothetical protein